MESYNLARLTKKIYESKLTFFSLKTLRDLIESDKESTLFHLIKRLISNEILIKIERDKYMLKGAAVGDFALANFLYKPSYISFESALNFYGILPQFPYQVTSATVKKTTEKIINGKSFGYFHLQKSLFWGYEKKNEILIAQPEKALLDQMYLSAKGIKRLDLDEYNLETINLLKLKEYIKKYPQTRQFINTINKIKQFLKR